MSTWNDSNDAYVRSATALAQQQMLRMSKWQDYVNPYHPGETYTKSQFQWHLRTSGCTYFDNDSVYDKYLSSRAFVERTPTLSSIESETDFKKRVPLYFQLLLQDDEFSSIYDRMSSDGTWIFIDRFTKQQVIIKDEYDPIIAHCLVHYAYIFNDFMPFDRLQLFTFLKNKLYSDLSSFEVIRQRQLYQHNFNFFPALSFFVSYIYRLFCKFGKSSNL